MSNAVVYILTLVESGFFYIGSSENLRRRITIHLSGLRNNVHPNLRLQKAWNESHDHEVMVNSFPMESIAIASEYEEKLIQSTSIGPRGHLMTNINFLANGSDSILRHPKREEIIRQMTETNRNSYLAMSAEERKKRYSKFGSKNGMFGKKHSSEMKERMSKMFQGHTFNKGIKLSEEHVEKIRQRQRLRTGEKNSFYGKKHKPEVLEKFRLNKLGTTPTNARDVSVDGAIFKSCAAVARHFKISQGLVTYRLKSDKYPTWFYSDKT